MPNAGSCRNGSVTTSGKVNRNAEMGALYLSGVSTRQLAERYGLQTPAITRALNKMGIKPHKQGRRHDNALAELVAEGLTVRAASAQLGITEQRGGQIWARIRAGLGWQAI